MTSPVELLGITGAQAIWKFQLAERGKSAITEVMPADLTPAYRLPPWFDVSADGSGTTLTAPIDGPHTSGSSYTRAEGREMTLDGKQAAWDSSKGCHRLQLWMRLDSIPDGAKVSLIQLHDDLDDQIQILCERHGGTYRLWWSVGLGKGKGGTTADIDVAFPAGVWVPCVLEVVPGRTGFYYGPDWSAPKVSTKTMRQSSKSYAKFGPYCQVSEPKGQNISASFHGVTMTHSATVPAGPPTRPGAVPGPIPAPVPVPVPSPAPTPVPAVSGPMILVCRHGEKPSDPNDHTLSPKGQQRAHALPPLFTTPRADLAKPSWIFASKGNTTSMRMLQTAQPTAAALGLPIDISLDSENAVTQTAQLLAKQANAGKVVLAVLEHSCIAAVASALVKTLGGKWNAKPPSSWADTDFSSIFVFRGDGKGNWVFSKTDEGVLEGDPGWMKPLPPPPPPPVVTPPPPPPVVDPPPPVPDPVPAPPPVPDPVPVPPPVPDPVPTPKPVRPAWWAAFIAALLAAIALIGTHGSGGGTPPPPPPPATSTVPIPTTTPAPVPSTTPVPVPSTTPAPTSAPPAGHGRAYPWHTNIVSTTFWVGERFNDNLADGSQTCSAYDSQWALHWGGVDNGQKEGSKTDCAGAALGGCDGVWHATKCDTEVRKAPDFWPSQAKPKENPFYLDLPYDDVNDATAQKNRDRDVPWAHDKGLTGGASLMKNRWVQIVGPSGRTCYGQVEDAGPSSGDLYHDAAYVFGSNDARPANKLYGSGGQGAGIDVAPALNGCLGFTELDGDTDHVKWQFVDDVDVPAGPWTRVITKSGVTP